jgi:hypothetical protein
MIVGSALDLPGPQRRQRVGPVEGLDLGLLVDRGHQRVVERFKVEPDDVDGLLGQAWIPAGRFVGTPSVAVGTSQYGRDYRFGYRLGLLERGALDFGLDVSGTRRESTMTPEPDHGVVTATTVTW